MTGETSQTWVRSRVRILGPALVALALAAQLQAADEPDRRSRSGPAKVYYLDGAGGGGIVLNWGRSVKKGLREARFPGEIESFSWQTQLGPLLDQNISTRYKRKKARELAGKIEEYKARHPDGRVSLIGLSAGTAVTLYTLEELPHGVQVENVILLSSSVSADYDLGDALRHVRNKMYVFTSDKDPVLKFLVPVAGTADGERFTRAAGLQGFIVPSGGSEELQREYDKLVHIAWSPELDETFRGGHTDTVSSEFVASNVAPLLMGRDTRAAVSGRRRLTGTPTGTTSNGHADH